MQNVHKYNSFNIYNKYTLVYSYTNVLSNKKTVLEYSTTLPFHVYIDEIDKGNRVVHYIVTSAHNWKAGCYF